MLPLHLCAWVGATPRAPLHFSKQLELAELTLNKTSEILSAAGATLVSIDLQDKRLGKCISLKHTLHKGQAANALSPRQPAALHTVTPDIPENI